MSQDSVLETHRVGFNPNTTRPHFWINLPYEYYARCLAPYFHDEGQPWPWVERYLGHRSSFRWDFDGPSGRFGFGRVGDCQRRGNTLHLQVFLNGRQYNRRVALTMMALSQALSSLRADPDQCSLIKTDREEIMQWAPNVGNEPKAHGIYGSFYIPAIRQLQAGLTDDEHAAINGCMQTVWRVTAPREYVQYADDSGLHISSDGRPILSCFGFGIASGVMSQDVSPKQWYITSDNMDGVEHGLTLLAGWFSLADKLWHKAYPEPR
jgi:hypothetical protein